VIRSGPSGWIRAAPNHALSEEHPDISTRFARFLHGSSGRPGFEVSFPLRCIQRLSRPHIATRRCRWRDNRYTRGASIPGRFFSVFPLSSQCYFQPWFGSCIPAKPSMKSPDFDFPLHLLLNRRRFCRHPSATASSTEAVDVVSALGRPPHLLPGSRSRFRLVSVLPSPL